MALPACWACGDFRLANILWFWPVVSNIRNTRARSQDTSPQAPIWLHLTKGLFSEVLLHQMAPRYCRISYLVLGSKPSPTSLGHRMLCQYCCAWVVCCGHHTFMFECLVSSCWNCFGKDWELCHMRWILRFQKPITVPVSLYLSIHPPIHSSIHLYFYLSQLSTWE